MELWSICKLLFWLAVLVVLSASILSDVRKRTWTIDVDGCQHVIELRPGFFAGLFGRGAITLDGNTVQESQSTGSDRRFDVDGHQCILKMRFVVISLDYELYLDGKLV